MKKILSAVIALAVVLSACGITVLAKGGMRKHNHVKLDGTESVDFVDENSDGVCDNKPQGGKHHRGERPVDAEISGDVEGSEGVEGEKPAKPNKEDCVDEDGDGVCDNKPEKGERPADEEISGDVEGSEGVEGEKPAKPNKEDCVDEDGDGVCDNKREGDRKQHGRKHGKKPAADVVPDEEVEVTPEESVDTEVSIDAEVSVDTEESVDAI